MNGTQWSLTKKTIILALSLYLSSCTAATKTEAETEFDKFAVVHMRGVVYSNVSRVDAFHPDVDMSDHLLHSLELEKKCSRKHRPNISTYQKCLETELPYIFSKRDASFQKGYFKGFGAKQQGQDPMCSKYSGDFLKGCLAGYKTSKNDDLPIGYQKNQKSNP